MTVPIPRPCHARPRLTGSHDLSDGERRRGRYDPQQPHPARLTQPSHRLQADGLEFIAGYEFGCDVTVMGMSTLPKDVQREASDAHRAGLRGEAWCLTASR